MRIRRLFFRGSIALGAVIMLTGAEGLDSGEIHCEEAARHLADCCHESIDRVYSCSASRGCDDHRPNLDDPLATQVKETSCEELIAQGACNNPPMSPPPPSSAPDLARPVDLSQPPDLARPYDLTGPNDLPYPYDAHPEAAVTDGGGDL